jgi:hypothetical protein
MIVASSGATAAAIAGASPLSAMGGTSNSPFKFVLDVGARVFFVSFFSEEAYYAMATYL